MAHEEHCTAEPSIGTYARSLPPPSSRGTPRITNEPKHLSARNRVQGSHCADEIAGDPYMKFGGVCGLVWQQGYVRVRVLFAVDPSGFHFYLAAAVAAAPQAVSYIVAGPTHAIRAKLEQVGPYPNADETLAEQLGVPVAHAPPTLQPFAPFHEAPHDVREESGSSGDGRYRKWFLQFAKQEMLAAHGVEIDRKERRWDYFVFLRCLIALQQQQGSSWQLSCRRAKDVKATMQALLAHRRASENHTDIIPFPAHQYQEHNMQYEFQQNETNENPAAAAAAAAVAVTDRLGEQHDDTNGPITSQNQSEMREQEDNEGLQQLFQAPVLINEHNRFGNSAPEGTIPTVPAFSQAEFSGDESLQDVNTMDSPCIWPDVSQLLYGPDTSCEAREEEHGYQNATCDVATCDQEQRPNLLSNQALQDTYGEESDSQQRIGWKADLEEAERLLGNSSLCRWLAERPSEDDIDRLRLWNAELSSYISDHPPMPCFHGASVPYITPNRARELLQRVKEVESSVGLRALVQSGIWTQVGSLTA